jgi:hypothetical protein
MDDDICAICRDWLQDDKDTKPTLSCGHRCFHDKCLLAWIIQDNNSCPVCRNHIISSVTSEQSVTIQHQIFELIVNHRENALAFSWIVQIILSTRFESLQLMPYFFVITFFICYIMTSTISFLVLISNLRKFRAQFIL